MQEQKWFTRPVFYIVMTLYLVWGFTTLGYGEKWAAMLYREDRYFEYMGAISLFVAAGLSFYIFFRAWKERRSAGIHWIKLAVYLGLALLYFFGAGEEISWGQRIFNIGQPAALAEENSQGELNIHNLPFIESNKLLKADNLFSVFWLGFAVLLPAAGLLSRRLKHFAENFVPVVYWGIGALFLVNYFLAKFAKSIYAQSYKFQIIPFAQAVQEVKESNYELLFVFLTLIVLWDLNRVLARSKQGRTSIPDSQSLQPGI